MIRSTTSTTKPKTRTKSTRAKVAPSTRPAAVMYEVDGKLYVMATRDTGRAGVIPSVQAFPNAVAAVRYFEDGYRRAHELGAGYSAGACISFMQLQPRVFEFDTIEDIQAILGKRVRAVTLSGSAVAREVVFEVRNVKKARAVYESGIMPRLTG